jgi:ubiquinone/menaquinone biosynthesis C-methylase UbiE
MDKETADKIRNANIQVHEQEAEIYNFAHPEIFGSYEQQKVNRDLDLIDSLFDGHRKIKALDMGCGTGNLTIKYLMRGYLVTAVDISTEMIDVLRRKIKSEHANQVNFVVENAEDFFANPKDQMEWDLISFSAVLHHLPDYMIVLSAAIKQLQIGGVLYVCHEPLSIKRDDPNRISSFMRSLLNFVDRLYIYGVKFIVYLKQSLKMRKLFRRIDYRWSDYHVDKGIDVLNLLQELETSGMCVRFLERNRGRFSSVLSRIDELFQISEPTSFRFIVQRTE